MGPGGYFCGCQRRITHANAYSHSNAHSYSDGHGYGYINAKTDAYAEICAKSEASSHTAATTVGIFATAKISSRR
jgi:hypothetical protein